MRTSYGKCIFCEHEGGFETEYHGDMGISILLWLISIPLFFTGLPLAALWYFEYCRLPYKRTCPKCGHERYTPYRASDPG